jgi:ribosomal protein S27AE
VILVRETCPRCKTETFELGAPIIKVGKKREMRVAVRECPRCALVFYEKMKEPLRQS